MIIVRLVPLCNHCSLYSCLEQIELVLHAILLLDRPPLLCIGTSVASQLACLALLKPFPYNQLSAPNSLASGALTLAATALWVRHFWGLRYSLEYIVAFCLVTVWLAPFVLLLGVTGDQSALPGASGFPLQPPAGQLAAKKQPQRRGLALRLFDIVRQKRDEAMPTLTSHLPGVTKEKM